MRVGLRIAAAALGVVAFFGALVSPAPLAQANASSSKIVNVLDGGRPLAASEAQFIEAALKRPASDACQMLSPDAAFREEMLLDVEQLTKDGTRRYQRRVALVIGNGDYQGQIGDLDNPSNDAASMAKMLRALGFTVYQAVDATEKSLDECFAKFKGDLKQSDEKGERADIALFFYAGHGVQLTPEGKAPTNYMLSIDAKIDAAGVATGFKQIDPVLNDMRAHSKQAIFLYDACRNAPKGTETITNANGVAIKHRSANLGEDLGAAPISVPRSEAATQAGLFIAYATSPGKTADDAWGPQGSRHSPFTKALLKNLPTPGVIFEEALVGAYYDVGELTGGQQTPWTSSSLRERILLNGGFRQTDATTKLRALSGESSAARQSGFRLEAIVAALMGMPGEWPTASMRRRVPFVAADLYMAYYASYAALAHGTVVHRAVISPAGDILTIAAASQVPVLWRREQPVHRFGAWADRAQFSSDGSYLLIVYRGDPSSRNGRSQNASAAVYDALRGGEVGVLSSTDVVDATFVDGGRRVATYSSDHFLRLWRIGGRTGLELVAELESAAPFQPHHVSHDGAALLEISGSQAVVREIASGRRMFALSAPDVLSHALFSRKQSSVVTVSKSGVFQTWSPTGKLTGSAQAQSGDFAFALMSDNGQRVLAATVDGTAVIFDVAAGQIATSFSVGASEALHDAAISPDGSLIATASFGLNQNPGDLTRTPGRVRTWSADNGLALKEFSGHQGFVNTVSFSPDGKKLATAAWDNTARIWDLTSGVPIFTSKPSQLDFIAHASFSSDGRSIVASSSDGVTAFFDATTGSQLVGLGRLFFAWRAEVSSDGKRLLAIHKNGARYSAGLWNLKSGNAPMSLGENVQSAAFSRDGRFIVTASGIVTERVPGVAELWDAATAAKLESIGRHDSAVVWAKLSPDNRHALTVTGENLATIWDIADRAEGVVIGGGGSLGGFPIFERANRAEFSVDGASVLTIPKLNVFNVSDGVRLFSLEASAGAINDAAYSPDGLRIVTAGEDATASLDNGNAVRVWDAVSGESLATLISRRANGADTPFFSARFAPDSRKIVAASNEKLFRVWDAGLYGPELLDAAYALLTDDLRAEVERERIRYWEIDPQLLQ